MPALERPAPPPGVELLTVPEACELSRTAAEARGDTQAILTKQDVWRDLRTGRLVPGRDAWWVDCPAHPSRGYWVLSREAVERRIQERLRGRGRPRTRPQPEEVAEESIKTPATPAMVAEPVGEPPLDEPSVSVPVELPAAEARQRAEASEGEPGRQPAPPVVAAIGNRGPVAWPVLDPQLYREAVRRALQADNRTWGGTLFVCRRCGWAGLDGDFRRINSTDGGWQDVCPSCGAVRLPLEGDVGYIHPTVRELRHLEQRVEEESQRTRNEKWASRLRGHLRHLEILASQAQLEEEITPGVTHRVAALRRRIEELLAEQVILPAIMRNLPSYQEAMQPLVEPRVRQVIERVMSPLRLTGDLPDGLLPDDGAVGLAQAILAGVVPAELVIPAIRELVRRGTIPEVNYVGHLMTVVARQAERLGAVSDDDRYQAILLEAEIERSRRPTEQWYTVAQEWVRRSWMSQHRWDRYRDLATQVHDLREDLTNLLRAAAQAEVADRVDREVERLATMAVEEAQRREMQPIEVAVAWVRSKKGPIPPDLKTLVAYPLAQRLLGARKAEKQE
jgi:hypothetical protein